MENLLGSHVKADVLLYLGLRGANSGRGLAKQLGISPTPVFKALRNLVEIGLLMQSNQPFLYALNTQYHFYDEILAMIYKTGKDVPYLPDIPEERYIDVVAIYQLLAARGTRPPCQKLSDVLRERYA